MMPAPGHLPADCTPREAQLFAAVWKADAERRQRRNRIVLAVLFVLAYVALVLGATVYMQRQQAARQSISAAEEAEARALVGDAMYECGSSGCDQ